MRRWGYAPDERRYDIASHMRSAGIGIRRIRCCTNNPDKLRWPPARGNRRSWAVRALQARSRRRIELLSTNVLRAGHLLNGYLKPEQSIGGTDAAGVTALRPRGRFLQKSYCSD